MSMALRAGSILLAYVFVQSPSPSNVLPQTVDRLLEDLRLPDKTEAAAQQLIKLGSQDSRTRDRIAAVLPRLLLQAPATTQAPVEVLYEETAVAGQLRLTSTIPALIVLLQQYNERFVPLTMTRMAELIDDPVGQALCMIRDEASLASFSPLLRVADSRRRMRMLRVLVCYKTDASRRLLEDYLQHEDDPNIREYLFGNHIGKRPDIFP